MVAGINSIQTNAIQQQPQAQSQQLLAQAQQLEQQIGQLLAGNAAPAAGSTNTAQPTESKSTERDLSGLPPGLAKKGDKLPPGLAKKEAAGALPPGLEKRVKETEKPEESNGVQDALAQLMKALESILALIKNEPTAQNPQQTQQQQAKAPGSLVQLQA